MRCFFILLISFIGLSCSQTKSSSSPAFGRNDLNHVNRKLLDVAMEDGFSPAIASRVYVYPHIAFYTTLRMFYPDSLEDLSSKLKGLKPLPDTVHTNADAELSSLLAFCKMGRKLVFSEFYMTDLANELKATATSRGLSQKVITASDRYSDYVVSKLVPWVMKDKYVETRTMERFTSTKKPGQWIETPPDYAPGLEPHWCEIRTLVIDTCSVFPAPGPPSYDSNKGSAFYEMVNDLYQHTIHLDTTEKQIALFWDDNPNESEHQGHMLTIAHKVSPPGHWLNIISQISTKQGSSLFQTTRAYTLASIAMFDGIISCWYEKYKTILVRPITYIQEHIDPAWRPLIQTPPFPEYTSGHSVISAAAATVLARLYGDTLAFTDSTETIFGIEPRSFTSFSQAAMEVSLSRYHAGIHYKQSVLDGNKQGVFIAQHVIDKILNKKP